MQVSPWLLGYNWLEYETKAHGQSLEKFGWKPTGSSQRSVAEREGGWPHIIGRLSRRADEGLAHAQCLHSQPWYSDGGSGGFNIAQMRDNKRKTGACVQSIICAPAPVWTRNYTSMKYKHCYKGELWFFEKFSEPEFYVYTIHPSHIFHNQKQLSPATYINRLWLFSWKCRLW
jgi:hypothetical protein